MLELSVVLPGIRHYNWKKLYESILKSTKCEFELVIVSPYGLPQELQQYKNIKLIRDFGSPSRCQQIALVNAEGKYLTYTADDALYFENALDHYINAINSSSYDKKNVVAGKYFEIPDMTQESMLSYNGFMRTDDYHRINTHPGPCRPEFGNYFFFGAVLISTEYAMEIGGFDCQFEGTAMAVVDFSVRLQRDNANVIFIQDCPLYSCNHMPNTTGDHAPVHFAQIDHDDDLFHKLSAEDGSRIRINPYNYKQYPRIWPRRNFELQ